MSDLHIEIDGGSRGNPGPAAAGIVIRRTEQAHAEYEGGFYLGRMTNNAAEYHALIRALELAGQHGGKKLHIQSDSELLVHQLNGVYRVKSRRLQPLFEQARHLLNSFEKYELYHVLRAFNTRADQLANMAMDAKRDLVITVDGKTANHATRKPEQSPPNAESPTPHAESLWAKRRISPRPSPDDTPTQPDDADMMQCRWELVLQGEEDQCIAGTPTRQAFTLGPWTPAGLCIHAAAAALHHLQPHRGLSATTQRQSETQCQRCGMKVCLKVVGG